MLDIKLIREDFEKVKNNLKKRDDVKILEFLDEVVKFDNNWKSKKKELDIIKSKRNKLSEEVNILKKQNKDFKSVILEVKKVSENIKELEKIEKELLEKRDTILNKIPNLLDEEVPIGTDDTENKVIRKFMEPTKFNFKVKTHQELCELNDWYDLETASKNSGSRFYFMKNELVFLELALYNYVLDKLKNKGFTIMEVPPMLKMEVASKCIPLGDFEDTIYKIENEGDSMCLIGTAEHTLSSFHINKLFQKKDLPILYAGLSPCYRREAGVTKDEKGIFRVHNFNKIEMFVYTTKEDSLEKHNFITNIIEEIFTELKIPFQIVDICTGDIGVFATRKFDLEAFLPGQNKYREMGSSSNYKDFGARKLNVRYQNEKNEIEYCHTLNNTACALQRTIIAILENYQREDGNVEIPEVLRKYFNNRKLLK